MDTSPAVAELAARLRALGWVTDLFVGGSLATGDHRAGVSDIDCVALTGRTIDGDRRSSSAISDRTARHPSWTHGSLVERPLSGIVRAGLVRHGVAVFGRPPETVLGNVSDDEVRCAAHAELTGYWAAAVRHATGGLITKTSAIDAAQAPDWLRADLRARRNGSPVRSPRLRTAWVAWTDARRTTAAARRWDPSH